ncbi:hypothetical protein HDU96_001352 [Phlyctochytrium bullatum]|nr:hypothetical protein HDU96_001352 [Phlyctochytrium bullatum]
MTTAISSETLHFGDDPDRAGVAGYAVNSAQGKVKASAELQDVDGDGSGGPHGHPERRSFWSSHRGIVLYTLLMSLPAVAILIAIIAVTNTAAWSSFCRGRDLVFVQQVRLRSSSTTNALFQMVTGILGVVIGHLVKQFAWMTQGAIAAFWAFRPRPLSLLTAEAIQTGSNPLLFKSATSLVDRVAALAVPIFCIALSFVYKFGITVRTDSWSGVLTTSLLDMRPILFAQNVVVQGCEDYECVQGLIDSERRWRLLDPNLEDFSFFEGVDYGNYSFSDTVYLLGVGDVPALPPEFRKQAARGIAFTQLFFRTFVDCSRPASQPWETDPSFNCTQRTFLDISAPSIGNFSICDRALNQSRFLAAITFPAGTSLNASCRIDIKVSARDVNAVPGGISNWNVFPTGKEAPLPENLWRSRLWAAEYIPLFFDELIVPFDVSAPVTTNATIPRNGTAAPTKFCFDQRDCCTDDINFVPLFTSRAASLATRLLFLGLHNPFESRTYIPPPIPNRPYLVPGSQFLGVLGRRNTSLVYLRNNGTAASPITPGVYATASMADTARVVVLAWVIVFAILPAARVAAACAKVVAGSHPEEPVGGLLWTVRNQHGVSVARAVEAVAGMTLRRTDAVIRMERREEATELVNGGDDKARKLVSSSTLDFDPAKITMRSGVPIARRWRTQRRGTPAPASPPDDASRGFESLASEGVQIPSRVGPPPGPAPLEDEEAGRDLPPVFLMSRGDRTEGLVAPVRVESLAVGEPVRERGG